MDSIYDQDIKAREKDQESIKAANGLEAKHVPDRISLSLTRDVKKQFIDYCEKNYISPSAQLRVWIAQFCKD